MTRNIKHSFILSIVIISSVIAMGEGLIMLLLGMLPQWGFILTPLQEILADTVLLSVVAAPLIWLLSLRPLAKQINEQQASSAQQIQENGQLIKALNVHALVSIADVTGRITHANKQFCEVSGYTENELIGQDHRILNSGHHDKDFFRKLWHTIANGQPWQGEVCNRNKQGLYYWVDSTIVPMLGLDGKPTQYISIRRNITKIKENETRLLSLKRALDASSEMILVTDDHGAIQYVNPALCAFTGWQEEQLVGRSPEVLDSPNADSQTLADMRLRLRQGRAWSGRLLSRRKGLSPFSIAGQTTPPDARDYWADVSVTAINNNDGALVGYVQVQRDISDQVAKEQSLLLENADTQARLAISEALQQALPLQQRVTKVLDILFNLKAFDLQRKGGIFLKDPEQDFLDMFVLHGKFSEEFIQREQRIPYGACLCGRAAISQELIISDDCFCDPRHDHVFEGMQAHGHYIVPIVSAGATLGILFLYTDPYPVQLESRLTMLKQVGDMLALALLQEQAKLTLEAARDAAEQAVKTKAEFLANMSHEIRTPMNGVLGMLDILKDTHMTHEQEDLVETAAHSAESLLTIINDILDFSKIEAGKIELEHIEFNLPTLVEEVCALMSGRAHAKGLELNCFLPPGLQQRWHSDPTRIRQVLTNLIGNAVKFTEHGEVSIKVFTQESVDDKVILRFEVRDTGIGMTPEGQARLFQPFSQADSSTSRRFGGTGLGLSISKNLVNIMQGTIGVESALGQGTCFWFSLPLQQSSNTAATPITDLSGKRALVVDDNATNRKILHHYLEHWGMDVSEEDNAPAALLELEAAFQRGEAYDILLSDLHMPDMDGLALANAINQHANIANTPRLLLSSGGMGSEAERLALGFAQSLLKPVRQTQLFEAITSALQVAGETPKDSPKISVVLSDYSHKRILVAEDNKVNQKVILAMLAKFKCTPTLAVNGKEALDLLAQERYDLILMDCQMPVMDGYEAVRMLRGQELTHNATRIPVVALTAHAAAEERDKCLSAGMDDFLTKPVLRSELAKVLANWLGDASTGSIITNEISDITAHPISKCWDEVTALKNLDNDQELLADMIDLFLTETPARILDLEDALMRNDLAALADAAHAIKGMAGHFCADQLKTSAATLEDSARHNNVTGLEVMTKTVTDAVVSLMAALQQKQGII
ncbi:MAG: response regulator [Methylotenera sp.]|nr:response regulator [Methylotenera sp.]MDD4927102.1 response regulator [Methylotenera sp.]